MTLASFATLAVATAFAALCVWVLWPGNRKRLEDHGRIPLDEGAVRNETSGTTAVESAKETQS